MVNRSTRSRFDDVPADPVRLGTFRSILVVAVLVLTTEVFSYEFIMVSPSLPNIAVTFRASDVSLVMTVVLLASAIVVPLISKLGDIHGKRVVLAAVVATFILGSLVCALAPSFLVFLVGRAVQSIGLGATVISYGLIRDLLPPRWVPIGIGGLGMGFGVSALVGPLVGGWLIDSYGFRSVFWLLLAYAAVMLALVITIVPESTVRIRHRLDYLGGSLLGLGAGAIVAATSVIGLGALLFPVGVVLLVVFVLYERRKSEPFMPIPLLTRPAVWLTLVCAAMIGFVTGSQLVLMPLMLRTPDMPRIGADGLGLNALQYGVHFALPMGATAAVAGFLAGWISRKRGPRNALIFSASGWTLGTALVAGGLAGSTGGVAAIAIFMGIGQGSYYAAAANLIIEAVPAKLQGVSASVKYTVEQGISAIAGAVAGVIIATDILQPGAGGHATIFGMGGFRAAFLVCAVMGAVAILATAAMRHGRMPATGGVAPDMHDASNPHPVPSHTDGP